MMVESPNNKDDSGTSSSETSSADPPLFVGVKSRATTKEGLAEKPGPGIPLTTGNTRNEIDCDELEESMKKRDYHNNTNEYSEHLDDSPTGHGEDPCPPPAPVVNDGNNDGTPCPNIRDSPTQELFVGESSLSKKSRMEKCTYISHLDNGRPPSNKTNRRPATGVFAHAHPYSISNLDENPARSSNNNNNALPADLEPMAMPAPTNNNVVVLPQQCPGAYAGIPGSNLQRLDQLRFSLVGVQPELLGQATMVEQEHDDSQELGNTNGESDSRIRDSYEEDNQNRGLGLLNTPTLPNHDNSDRDGLVKALPVSTSFYGSSRRMMAQPVENGNFVRHDTREANDKKRSIIAGGIVAIALLVLVVSVAVGLTKQEEYSNDVGVVDDEEPPPAPTGSPTRQLPPMMNLDLLYGELPEKSRESLYSSESPQYQAWEWLLNHPDIATYPEWRKKQVFAMVTFFYSFEGPNWPAPIRNKWLNVTASECNWTLNEAEVLFFTREAASMFGPDAYSPQDVYPCNQNGEVQTLIVHQLYFSDEIEPHMPPEIQLLTSLKGLAIQSSQIGGSELSDFLVPEIIQLPRLEYLSFHRTGIGGTIPKELGGMTGLRHLIIGGNQLTGSFPSEIANMSSLEHLVLWRNNIFGSIPSELGRLASLSALRIDHNLFTGQIPSEFGLITNIQGFRLENNALSGSVPTQLGWMTNCTTLSLGNDVERSPEKSHNNFNGSLPTELWQLSNLEELFLYNLPDLHGSIPKEMMLNLTLLRLEGSPNLGGTIPEAICSLQEQKFDYGAAMDFDCSSILCGCDCHCINNKTNNP